MQETRLGESRFSPAADRGAVAVPTDPRAIGAPEHRDLITWGPIFGGLVTVIAVLAILSSLGLAIGFSAIDPGTTGLADISTGAWIWSIATAAIAFLLGGIAAARSAAAGGTSRGLVNGLMVGAASITAMLLLVGFGAGALLGAGASALGDVVNAGDQVGLAENGETITTVFERAESGAWGTFAGLTLAVALAGLGGLIGARRDAPEQR